MATTEEVIAFIREQATKKTYEQVQGDDESPADCGNYDDAYEMGVHSGWVEFAQRLTKWLNGGAAPVLNAGFTRDDEDEDTDEPEDE